jgi:hypothetical protein
LSKIRGEDGNHRGQCKGNRPRRIRDTLLKA